METGKNIFTLYFLFLNCLYLLEICNEFTIQKVINSPILKKKELVSLIHFIYQLHLQSFMLFLWYNIQTHCVQILSCFVISGMVFLILECWMTSINIILSLIYFFLCLLYGFFTFHRKLLAYLSKRF